MYADQTAVLGPLATYAEPHAYDLCEAHSERLSAPRGWEVMRLAQDPRSLEPTSDDLLALADAVREAARPPPVPRAPRRRSTSRARTTAAAAPAAATCARSPPTDGSAPARGLGFRACSTTSTPPARRTSTPSSRRTTSAAWSPRPDRRGPGPRGRGGVRRRDRRRDGSSSATTCGRVLAGAGRRLRRGCRRGRCRRGDDRAGLDRPALLRLRPPRASRARCSPPATTPRVQRHQDVPCRRVRRSAWRPGWPRSATGSPRATAGTRPRPGSLEQQDVLAAYAAHLLTLAPVTGRRLKVVVDAGNGMAGPHRAGGVRPARRPGRPGAAVLRARRHLPEPRGQPDRAGEPRRPPEGGALRAAPTSAWPSTATPTAASSSTSAAAVVGPSDAHRADRRPRAGPEPGRHGDPQPDHLPRGPGDRHRARRHPGPDPGRALVHQGHDGRDRRGLRRRAQRPLLLPRLLARRLRDARRAARAGRAGRDRPPAGGAARATYERYVASGEINSEVADQRAVVDELQASYGGRRGVEVDHLDGLTVDARRLVVQCARRPTPSRCCG